MTRIWYKPTPRVHAARWLLRMALAFTFAYAGIAGLVTPASWVGYLPGFVSVIADPMTVLGVWSIAEVGLAVWILTGNNDRHAGLLAAVLLLLIVVFNLSQLSILFRDLALAAAAVSLVVLPPATS